ncbi:MAG: ergothioneine biosynthesis protein EgtB, partial [Hyphomicrobiaceae bacterium]
MTTSVGPRTLPSSNEELLDVYRRVRAHSLALAAPLSAEDAAIQSMPDASPTKWHLAHTTWFFETFVLLEHHTNFQCFHEHFGHLFNSYYNSVGSMFARPNRGLLSRPSLPEVLDYRAAIDAAMESLLAERSDELRDLVVLGLNHEQQHQELLLTDFKHVLSLNPLRPVYRTDAARPAPLPHDAPHDAPHDVPLDAPLDADTERTWLAVDEGLHWIGHDGTGFAFDNEGPRHRVFLEACEVAATPVTNGEYTLFIDDGGYQNPLLWLSDGWACSSDLGWSAPMYWERQNDEWFEFTLGGLRAVDPSAPVTHLSHYEAD